MAIALATSLAVQPARGQRVSYVSTLLSESFGKNNRVDDLIRKYGRACIHVGRGRPCRVDAELAAYFKSLKPEKAEIARELMTLGAVCDDTPDSVACVFNRHSYGVVELPDANAPIHDDLFRVEFIAVGADGALTYTVKFVRTTLVRKSLR